MYAIIRSGGKQYRVQAGDVVRVEKLEKELGAEFDMNDIILVGGDKTFIGEPVVKDATVTVVVTNQSKAPKVIVFKKKRRQGYRRMQGHRQLFTELFIKAITSPEGDISKAETKANVRDPQKREAVLADRVTRQKTAKTEKRETPAAAAPKAAKAAGAKAKGKRTAKKAGAKKAVKKKAGAKSGAKKTAKKKTSK